MLQSATEASPARELRLVTGIPSVRSEGRERLLIAYTDEGLRSDDSRSQMTTSRVAGYVLLTLRARREGEQYVSECVELGVASCGGTIDEAFEAIKDAAAVYLQTLDDEGELERVLAARGVEVIPGEPPEEGGEIRVMARPKEYVSAEPLPLPIPA